MSSVRMCDNCGTIFSENTEGWTTVSGSQRRKSENGHWYMAEVNQDWCVECTNKFQSPPEVKALNGGIVVENQVNHNAD